MAAKRGCQKPKRRRPAKEGLIVPAPAEPPPALPPPTPESAITNSLNLFQVLGFFLIVYIIAVYAHLPLKYAAPFVFAALGALFVIRAPQSDILKLAKMFRLFQGWRGKKYDLISSLGPSESPEESSQESAQP